MKKIVFVGFSIALLGVVSGGVLALPEQPAINRDVHAIEGTGALESSAGRFVNPHMPPLRTSSDGRVAVSMNGFLEDEAEPISEGTSLNNSRKIRFYLHKPEMLTEHFIEVDASVNQNPITDAEPYGVVFEDGIFKSTSPGEGETSPFEIVAWENFFKVDNYDFDGDEDVDGNDNRSDFVQSASYDSEEDTYNRGPVWKKRDIQLTSNFSLCDGTTSNFQSGERNNPRACNADGGSNSSGTYDCYDVSIMVSTVEVDDFSYPVSGGKFYDYNIFEEEYPQNLSLQRYIRMWMRDVTIIVEYPKSPTAKIFGVKLHGDGPVAQTDAQRFHMRSMVEPAFTNDGRLLVARIGTFGKADQASTWNEYGDNDNDPPLVAGFDKHPYWKGYIDMGYSYNAIGACNIAGWEQMHPITNMYHDTRLNPSPSVIGDAKYGLAEYPLKDAEGNVINAADGEAEDGNDYDVIDFNVAYPWMDRHARNLFFTSYGVRYKQGESSDGRISDIICVDSEIEPDEGDDCYDTFKNTDHSDRLRGISVAGLWTKGKTVVLDGMFNNIDYGLEAHENRQLWAKLYAGTGSCADGVDDGALVGDNFGEIVNCKNAGYVRLGSGRDKNDNGWTGGGDFYDIPGYVFNTAFIDSPEQLFNFKKEAKPVTPRDVVWLINNGHSSDEVVFDDFVDNNVLIYSNMMPTVKYVGTVEDYEPKRLYLYDGWYNNSNYDVAEAHLQNSSARSDAPEYGILTENARIEPAALGGINGRGLWLDAVSSLTYDAVPVISGHSYLGIYLDTEHLAGTYQELVTFPAWEEEDIGNRIFIRTYGDGIQLLLYTTESEDPETINLSSLDLDGWVHLGFLFKLNSIEFYLDGYLFKTLTSTHISALGGSGWNPFSESGSLIVGGGVQAWIDDFKVIIGDVSPEVACNHANGTLIRIDEEADDTWESLAATYPAASHEVIEILLDDEADTRYSCYHDYSADYAAHLGNIPEEHQSVREALLMPEGPLYHDVPRPDSSNNTFCQSCHVGTQAGNPLSLHALYGAESLVGPHSRFLPVKTDQRRQPMQPSPFVRGVLPANNWLGGSFAGLDKRFTDEWLLSKAPDTDTDGIANIWEDLADANLTSATDDDSDGLLDIDEIGFGLSLLEPDSDGDSVNDGDDDDDWFGGSDGLSFNDELALGTDPLDADSDDDAELDGEDNCALALNEQQLDLDEDGYGNACDGDVTNDDRVNIADLRELIANGLGTWVNSLFDDMPATTTPHINKAVSEIDQGELYQWSAEGSAYEPGPSGLDCAGTIPCPE